MARVVIGLSGGVDSSVAAYLLKQQGHDVVGLFMINWHDTTGTLEGDCPWHDDRVFAELVAKKLDIPLHVVDLSADYRTRVVDYMFSEYEKGRTPNPDVLCNREIKFDVFLREALRLGADFVATGHYCRKAEETLPDGRTIYKLLAGTDPNKDQSYFLCQLSQEQLRYALFPVGDLLKPEVRRIAAEQGLATAKRKDSQGICFVGKVDLPAFLQQKLASKRGNVHEILPTWPKYGPKARIPAGTPDAGQAIPAPASPAAERPDDNPHSPGGQHAADVPPTTEQLAALAAPWRYTVRDGKKIGEHSGAHFYTIGQRKGLGIGGIVVHPRHRHRAERHLCRRGRQPPRPVATGTAYRPPRDTLGQPRAHDAGRPKRPLQRPHPLPPAFAGGHALRPRPGSLHPLRRPPAGHHTGAVRRMVRRRRAGRFGGNLGIVFPIPAPSEKRFQAPCRTGAAYIAAFPKHRFVFSQKANTYFGGKRYPKPSACRFRGSNCGASLNGHERLRFSHARSGRSAPQPLFIRCKRNAENPAVRNSRCAAKNRETR